MHLGIATSSSTDNFLQAFRTFIALRGRPAIVQCDNCANFTGAKISIGMLFLSIEELRRTLGNLILHLHRDDLNGKIV